MSMKGKSPDGMIPIMAIALLILSALITPLSAGTADYSAVLVVFPDGWVDVTISIRVNGTGPVAFRLDGDPSYLLVEGDGLLLNYTLKGEVIRVDPAGSSLVNISYQTPSLTSKAGAVWNLTARLDVNVTRIYLPKGSIILGMSAVPKEIELKGDWMELIFDGGDVWVAYKLGRIIPSEPAGSKPARSGEAVPASRSNSTIGLSAEKTTAGSSGGAEVGEGGGIEVEPSTSSRAISKENQTKVGPYIAVAVVVAIPIALLGLKLIRSGNRANDEAVGDELEERIISLLRERGGREYQSTIIRELEEPRATVWRRIRRMEREGRVRLRKEGRLTIIELADGGS